MDDIEKFTDEDGFLFMCQFCRFTLVGGDKNNKVLVANFFSNPPSNTKFISCKDCQDNLGDTWD